MPKNIAIFFDGTSNKYGTSPTNVLRAYEVTTAKAQQKLYCPGVGSISDKREFMFLSKVWKQAKGLALGYGLQERVIQAYTFLAKYYKPDDNIYLFGFSRGSYTAKVFAGLLHSCGLLHVDDEHLIPYAYELYTKKKIDFKINAHFKATFSIANPRIHFMGLWDSVSSVGSIFRMRNFPYTTKFANVDIARHAYAIDEKRALFRQNQGSNGSDTTQVWFTGVHTDVGGGNKAEDNLLAKIPFKWIMDEAIKADLDVYDAAYKKLIAVQDPTASKHLNNFLWFPLELIPRYKKNYKEDRLDWTWPLFRRRQIPEDAFIHSSVKSRMENDSTYKPGNLPDNPKYID